MKKKIWNWVFIVLSLFAFGGYLYWKEGAQGIIRHASSLVPGWVLMGFVFYIASQFGEATVLWVLSRTYDNAPAWTTCLRSVLIGNMAGFITPMMAGNMPAQIAILTRAGLHLGDSATLLLMKTISYQASYTILILLSALYGKLLRGGFGLITPIWVVIYIGIFLSAGTVLLFIVILRADKLITKLAIRLIRFLARLKIIRKPEDMETKVVAEIHRMSDNYKTMKDLKPTIIKAVMIGVGQLFCLMLVTYAVYRSLGRTGLLVFDVTSLQAYASLIQAYIPIPGGLGVSDTAFLEIMKVPMGPENVDFAMILWRLLAFYAPIMYGVVALGFKKESRPSPPGDGRKAAESIE